MFTDNEISQIVRSQLDTLLWSEHRTNEEGDMLESFDEDYDADDATPELVATLTAELTGDLQIPLPISDYRNMFGEAWLGQFGHDLALTRNHHGAGFWDRGLGFSGDLLSGWASSLGTLNVFDDFIPERATQWEGMFHAE